MERIAFFFGLLVFSQVGNISKFAEAGPLAVCFWRLAFAALFISPFLLLRRNHKELRNLSWRQAGLCTLSSISLLGVFVLFVTGIQSTTVAVTTILFSLHPLFTAGASAVLFREKIGPKLLGALALGFAGVIVLFGEDLQLGGADYLGQAAALGSAGLFSVYLLSGKVARQQLSNSSFAFLIYTQAAVAAAVSMWYLEIPFAGYSAGSWMAFIGLAVGPTLLGHALFTWCLQYMNVNLMSCASLIHPVLAAIGAYLFFSESVTLYTAASFTLTTASVALLFMPQMKFADRRAEKPAPSPIDVAEHEAA